MVGAVVEKITDVERKNLRHRIAGRAASVQSCHGVVGEKHKVHIV